MDNMLIDEEKKTKERAQAFEDFHKSNKFGIRDKITKGGKTALASLKSDEFGNLAETTFKLLSDVYVHTYLEKDYAIPRKILQDETKLMEIELLTLLIEVAEEEGRFEKWRLRRMKYLESSQSRFRRAYSKFRSYINRCLVKT